MDLRHHGRNEPGPVLVYDPAMAEYRFDPPHPMRPERFTGAVELMRERGLLEPPVRVVAPRPATDAEIVRIHDVALVETVRAAGADPTRVDGGPGWHGIGPGDTPAFPRMHEAASLVAGGTIASMRLVLDGEARAAFNPAGGMHHAHRDRVAGFCVYNDCAIALADATIRHPGLRVAYVDIDAHHGDGVEEAFYTRDDVLTLSVHESGQYLYPGTGASRQTGAGDGTGFALNVPLPPFAGDECYALVLDEIIAPALEAFAPDVIMLQAGADTHRDDPLAHLDLTVEGFARLVRGIDGVAMRVCDGRLVVTGGGGYEYRTAVPRMWADAFAILCDSTPPSTPEASPEPDAETCERALDLTLRTISELREHHPLLAP